MLANVALRDIFFVHGILPKYRGNQGFSIGFFTILRAKKGGIDQGKRRRVPQGGTMEDKTKPTAPQPFPDDDRSAVSDAQASEENKLAGDSVDKPAEPAAPKAAPVEAPAAPKAAPVSAPQSPADRADRPAEPAAPKSAPDAAPAVPAEAPAQPAAPKTAPVDPAAAPVQPAASAAAPVPPAPKAPVAPQAPVAGSAAAPASAPAAAPTQPMGPRAAGRSHAPARRRTYGRLSAASCAERLCEQ